VRRSDSLPELLCPAGSMECLYAAVMGGADAIYVGGKRFGARAYASNFDEEELRRAVNYCHLHGVKLYVTVNTLIEDSELSSALEYCSYLYSIGADAVIVADVGLISLLHRHLPELELHASTQLSVHNASGAEAAFEMGCSRVVPARELSRANIETLTERTRAEVEVFLHGALCVCHSGQCLFSSLVGGRSGNRGECAQPCRLPYGKGEYPLSLRDLCLAGHIRELIDSGVASLKIEGRMKSADYVYTVARIYRRLLDEGRDARPEEQEELRRAFSRGGFTDGYFTGKLSGGMLGIRTDADKQDSRSVSGKVFEPIRTSVRACASFRLGAPATLTLYNSKKRVTVTGDTPTEAINAPLTENALRARISKMGGTLLTLAEDDIEIDLDEGINLSPAAINALRRKAVERFEDSRRGEEPITIPALRFKKHKAQPLRAATLMREATFSDELCSKFDIVFLPLFSEDSALAGVKGVHLPAVITDSELPSVKKRLAEVSRLGIKFAEIGNVGQISLALEAGLTPCGGFRLNITNRQTAEYFSELGVKHLTLSPELTLPKARDVGGGVIVYGRIPLMITERCFTKDSFGCERCDNAALTDRRGERFPIMREHPHRSVILNSVVTYMGDRQRELRAAGMQSLHFLFTCERAEEALAALSAFDAERPLDGKPVRRMGRRDAKQ